MKEIKRKSMLKEKENITKRKICGIYKITSPTGRIYIGQAIDILKRWRKYSNLINSKNQIKLNRSLKKYEYANHIFEIVEECSIDVLNDREIYWGLFYDTLHEKNLNLRLGNSKSVVSEETKKRLSEAGKGRKLTSDQIDRIRRANIGKVVSDDTRKKMSKIHKGKTISTDQRLKLSIAGKNRKLTEDHKKKIGKAHKNRKWTDEHKKNLSNSLKDKNLIMIIQCDMDFKPIKEWQGIIKAADFYDIYPANISNALSGKNKSCIGFKWMYK